MRTEHGAMIDMTLAYLQKIKISPIEWASQLLNHQNGPITLTKQDVYGAEQSRQYTKCSYCGRKVHKGRFRNCPGYKGTNKSRPDNLVHWAEV